MLCLKEKSKMSKLFLFFIIFLLSFSLVISQKECNAPCSYDDLCDENSECPACMDEFGSFVGPGGEGSCQPYYSAPEISTIGFYLIVGFCFLVVMLVLIRLKKRRNR